MLERLTSGLWCHLVSERDGEHTQRHVELFVGLALRGTCRAVYLAPYITTISRPCARWIIRSSKWLGTTLVTVFLWGEVG